MRMDSIKFYEDLAKELEVSLKKLQEFNKTMNNNDEYDFEHDLKQIIDGMNNTI
jgi:hypothetical protein